MTKRLTGSTAERGERPELARGDRVRVIEENIEPWTGTVGAVKPSFDTWRVEVERDDDGMTWSIALATTRLEQLAEEMER